MCVLRVTRRPSAATGFRTWKTRENSDGWNAFVPSHRDTSSTAQALTSSTTFTPVRTRQPYPVLAHATETTVRFRDVFRATRDGTHADRNRFGTLLRNRKSRCIGALTVSRSRHVTRYALSSIVPRPRLSESVRDRQDWFAKYFQSVRAPRCSRGIAHRSSVGRLGRRSRRRRTTAVPRHRPRTAPLSIRVPRVVCDTKTRKPYATCDPCGNGKR